MCDIMRAYNFSQVSNITDMPSFLFKYVDNINRVRQTFSRVTVYSILSNQQQVRGKKSSIYPILLTEQELMYLYMYVIEIRITFSRGKDTGNWNIYAL